MGTKLEYPPGMSIITVTGALASAERSRSGYVRLYCQRKFGYINSGGWMMDKVSERIWLKSGRFALRIPHSGQPGIIGDFGEPLQDPVAYKIVLTPTESSKVETLAWTLLHATLGSPVVVDGSPTGDTTIPFTELPIKLDDWPASVVVVNPPPGGDGSYVPVSIAGNTGDLGYWSPSS